MNYSITLTPVELQSILAEKLRILRKEAHYTQADMAARSGVSLGSLKRFERTGQISLASFLRLLAVFGRLDEMKDILQSCHQNSEAEKLFSERTRKR